jgi:nicotinamide riboside transporter PnuC
LRYREQSVKIATLEVAQLGYIKAWQHNKGVRHAALTQRAFDCATCNNNTLTVQGVTMTLTDFDIQLIGGIGSVLFLISYALVSTNRIPIHAISYQTMNLIGAITFIIIAVHFNTYAPLILNIFWALIAGWSIIKTWRQPYSPSPNATQAE